MRLFSVSIWKTRTTHCWSLDWRHIQKIHFPLYIFFKYNCAYLFLAVRGLHCCTGFPLVEQVEEGDYYLLRCTAFPLQWLLLLRSTGFSTCGSWALSMDSIVVAHRSSCSEAGGILLDSGSNPYLLHWQADSLPLSHQGSPDNYILYIAIWTSLQWNLYF